MHFDADPNKNPSFTTQCTLGIVLLSEVSAGKHFNNDVLAQRNNETKVFLQKCCDSFFFLVVSVVDNVRELLLWHSFFRQNENWFFFTHSYLKYETCYYRWRSYQAVFKVVTTSSTITSSNIKVTFMYQSLILFCWELEKCLSVQP